MDQVLFYRADKATKPTRTTQTLPMPSPHCKYCGSERTSRTERKGFLQRVVLFRLGRFPWECNACWKVFLSTERGKRTRRSNPARDNRPLDTTNA